jgi:hypothetical protein
MIGGPSPALPNVIQAALQDRSLAPSLEFTEIFHNAAATIFTFLKSMNMPEKLRKRSKRLRAIWLNFQNLEFTITLLFLHDLELIKLYATYSSLLDLLYQIYHLIPCRFASKS